MHGLRHRHAAGGLLCVFMVIALPFYFSQYAMFSSAGDEFASDYLRPLSKRCASFCTFTCTLTHVIFAGECAGGQQKRRAACHQLVGAASLQGVQHSHAANIAGDTSSSCAQAGLRVEAACTAARGRFSKLSHQQRGVHSKIVMLGTCWRYA